MTSNKISIKGQLHTTETIAVLFIFFLLVLFGFVFYVQISKSLIEDKAAEIAGEKAVTLSLETLFLPELRCSKGENIPVKDCIDLYKLNISMNKINDSEDYYFDIFGYADIYVTENYPGDRTLCIVTQENPKGCTLYSKPKPNFGKKIHTPLPIVIYNPLSQGQQPEFYFGVLTVDYYS